MTFEISCSKGNSARELSWRSAWLTESSFVRELGTAIVIMPANVAAEIPLGESSSTIASAAWISSALNVDM